ncbi:AAA family ATPase [Microvirga alba]|uniref:AAA family ATPase n=1 Tax=Microvirga alba TaxID=2791025 RepID=A0A931FQ71_9HYPH|nr:AAA family ATPase [Microvirga alba]MBF9235550.1 AAA family ATPase [Microvirga alba]
MSILNIRKAQREGARLVVGISGISGSGKTYTALQLAYGLANYDASKVGFLDTENRRGSLYADALKNEAGEVQQFWIGDLYAPFSPQRYIDAILEFQKLGVEVLVIDSVTHEWEGQGGCEEIATAGNPRLPDWKRAKAEHKRFVNTLLQSDMHIVACIRAREKVSVQKVDGKTVVEPLGVLPVCEKNFMFEMTASLMMWNEGKAQQVMKCPAELRDILGRENGYISAQDGKALRAWVDGAKQQNPALEHARNSLRTVTEQGVDALKEAWQATPANLRKQLGAAFLDELKAAAQSFDAQRATSNSHQVDELNQQVLGNGAQAAA